MTGQDVYATSDGPNRRRALQQSRAWIEVLADRLHWPDGARDACIRLENTHPGWFVAWLNANTFPGFERPAGFWAVFDEGVHHVDILEADPVVVEQKMIDGPPEHEWGRGGCAWCRAHIGQHRVRI